MKEMLENYRRWFKDPYILEMFLTCIVWGVQAPAFTKFVQGAAAVHAIAGNTMLYNAITWASNAAFTNSQRFRKFLVKNLKLLLTIDGLAHSTIAILLGLQVVSPSVYVLIVPIITCTFGELVFSIWRQVPNIIYSKKERRMLDQMKQQATYAGCFIGAALCLIIPASMWMCCWLIIILSWIDNIFLVWLIRHKHIDKMDLAEL